MVNDEEALLLRTPVPETLPVMVKVFPFRFRKVPLAKVRLPTVVLAESSGYWLLAITGMLMSAPLFGTVLLHQLPANDQSLFTFPVQLLATPVTVILTEPLVTLVGDAQVAVLVKVAVTRSLLAKEDEV